jgi:hypothetical protein
MMPSVCSRIQNSLKDPKLIEICVPIVWLCVEVIEGM